MERSYVYPNVSDFNRSCRGSLQKRWICALEAKCKYTEVPAHFIMSNNDIKKTDLNSGSFLTREAISVLYDNSAVPPEVIYILHSEFRSGLIKWRDQNWVNRMVEMLILIANHFGVPPIAVEIHPGGRNTNDDLINATRLLLQKYKDGFDHLPLILLENRTKQFISNGKQLARFWRRVSEVGDDIIGQMGIVLDVQQLFTSVNEDIKVFLEHLRIIPEEAIKGVHIHYGHRNPTKEDPIPWKSVFSFLSKLSQPLIINPEVHHHNQVRNTISFCESMFSNSLTIYT